MPSREIATPVKSLDFELVAPEYRTTLEEDMNLENFIRDFQPLLKNGQDFYKGATFAHLIITTMPGVDLPEAVSEKTIEDFRNDVDKYYERNELLGHNSNWYVKNPKSKKPEYYWKERDHGETLLKPHLSYNLRNFVELTDYFKGFENPTFKLGAFTVLTLKELEAQRVEEGISVDIQISEPIPLVPDVAKLIKSA